MGAEWALVKIHGIAIESLHFLSYLLIWCRSLSKPLLFCINKTVLELMWSNSGITGLDIWKCQSRNLELLWRLSFVFFFTCGLQGCQPNPRCFCKGGWIRTPVKEAMSPINSVSPQVFPFFIVGLLKTV